MAFKSGKVGRTAAIAGARLEALLAGMSSRDRKLFLGMTGGAALIIFAVVTFGMVSSIKGLREEISSSRAQVAQASEMRVQYERELERAMELEGILEEHASKDLSAFLESAATSANVADRLTSVRETSVTTVDGLEERHYTVNLSSMTLEQMANFLFEAEGGSYPLTIKSANVRTSRRGDEKQMTLKLEVASFRLVEEE